MSSREEVISLISDLAAAFTPECPYILDLGAGAGDLTWEIFEYKPGGYAWLIDISEEMVDQCRKRFEGNPYIHVLQYDLNTGLPSEVKAQKFDVVVSSFAMHHVEPKNRLSLYANILSVLKPGSLFINGDRFRAESPDLAEWEHEYWIKELLPSIRQQYGKDVPIEQVKSELYKHLEHAGHNPGTLWQMEEDLRQAGFAFVDCIWKHYTAGIVVAVK
jgi:ubiquinone/menaquinone biosynthesis C-methylase UbiE